MTLTDLIIKSRNERELTPYQKFCLEEIEKKKNYQIVVEEDCAIVMFGKKK